MIRKRPMVTTCKIKETFQITQQDSTIAHLKVVNVSTKQFLGHIQSAPRTSIMKTL